MSPVLIAVVVIILLFVIAIFAWKITSENKAKKNYKPPVANDKIVLPEMKDEQFPARTRKNLRFCPSCGVPNSDHSAYCTECGTKL